MDSAIAIAQEVAENGSLLDGRHEGTITLVHLVVKGSQFPGSPDPATPRQEEGLETNYALGRPQMPAMPSQIKEMFEGLQVELWHLHIKTKFWHQLFGPALIRRKLLDHMANLLFDHINDSLFIDIISRVTRLNDPVRSAGKLNWNIAAIKELVEKDLAPTASI